jgi:hypothetical protein
MSAPTAPEALSDELRRHGDAVLETLNSIDAARLAPTTSEDWGAHQLLAHIASIEWTYPRLIEVAASRDSGSGAASDTDRPSRGFRGGNDDYNARQVERRASTPATDLIAEFARNRDALVSAVQSVDPTLLGTPIRSAGGIEGTLAQVIRAVAVIHVDEHLGTIVEETTR